MAAIDGLSSGLDTASIINQLMQLERVPQSRLKAQQSSAESSLTTLRTLNTKYLSIVTAAEKLGAGVPLPGATASPPAPSDWSLTSATSSDTARVSVSATTGAAAGSLSFHVRQLATAASHLSGEHTGKGALLPPGTEGAPQTTFVLGQGATATALTTDGTLGGTVEAVNAARLGVTASLLQVSGEGDTAVYRMQLTADSTGAGALTLRAEGAPADDPGLVPTEVVRGQDAVLDLGNDVLVSRRSNTISDVLQGVTLTLKKADTAKAAGGGYAEAPATLTVRKDVEGIATKVQALVDAANAARSESRSLTAADPVTGTRGRLYGESTVRSLVDRVRSVFSADPAALAAAGVTVDRDGVARFDRAAFVDALRADPATVEAALGSDGLAGRLHALAHLVSRPATADGGPGLVTGAITSKEQQISRVKSGVESWDRRLEMKQKQLQRQYTALEVALGTAQSQGQWLAGQLNALPRTNQG